MADIRIKDLTTEVSSTATGDFFVIDGTTGTRKTPAFNPTFGGNATVTGTLTVNGVATAGSYLTSAAGLAFPGALSASGYYLYSGSANGLTMYGYGSTYDVYIGNRAGTRALSVAANSTVVSIPDTTASTSTSSGALVVGNGTSGGLGVGGEINAGAAISTTQFGYTGQLTSNALAFSRNSFNYVYLNGGSSASLNFFATTTTSNDTQVFAYNNTRVAIVTGTASSNTSSGALQVTGGVGVSGAINAGSSISSWTGTFVARSASANPSFYAWTEQTVADRGVLGFEAASSTLKYRAGGYSMSTGTEVFSITSGGNTTIGGDLIVPGQGKAINAQGYFLFKGAYCNIFSRGTSGGWGTGLVFHSSNTDPSASIVHDPTSGDLTLYTNATASNYASTDRALLINTSKQVQVLSSTNSTGIASGALLVSGGVGVAGAVYAGGNIDASGGADFTSVAASFARISTVASAPRLTLVRSGSTSNRRAFDIINNADGLISMRFVNDDLSGSTLAATISYTGDFRITGTLQVGNTYASGAPTATGYIVIKDSTGTSYKIPAVAL